MNQALQDLIWISNITGKDRTLVQGGGGNTSTKTSDGKYMYIKASGTALKDMNEKVGWRRMRIDPVLSIMSDKELAKSEPIRRETEVVNRLLMACDDNVTDGSRPSVEAHLHALLDRYVIHLHPNAVGAYVNAKNGKARLENLFQSEKYPPLWVPYVDPGFMLARKIHTLVKSYKQEYRRQPQVLFLEKHGLFVTASAADAAVRIVRKVIRICTKPLKPLQVSHIPAPGPDVVRECKLALRKAVYQVTGEYPCVKHFLDGAIAAFMRSPNASRMLAAPSLTPDEMIYANGPSIWVDDFRMEKVAKKLQAQISRGDKPASTFLVKGVGLFYAGAEKMAGTVRDIVHTSFFIRSNAWRMGGIHALNKRQRDFIDNWESEAFRKALVSGAGIGSLKDRIAVVTGAGSGLGRSIAIGLARAGAKVALADVDTDAAQETAAMIEGEIQGASVMSVFCNVTNEGAIEEAYAKLLEQWGGLDILVNAAGVAPAFPLMDTPVDQWRFALEVNLTGYMLMAKHASRIMIAQGMGGAIVNISSKSGIDASKNNSAYNATKSGELHLTRGWAMELGPHHIRVNAVCPGNVFQGSKIWNPQYIRACAKKYGIKPDEVIPYYVNKTMLRLEIEGQDIADAVVFLSSDQARRITAQTVVVDAGQAMVR